MRSWKDCDPKKKINAPIEPWHQHAIYELGTKVKGVNECLYNEPHKYLTPPKWCESLDIMKKLSWSDDEWAEATHSALYKGIKNIKENKSQIRTQNGKKINWNKHTSNKISRTQYDEEMMNNYRTAMEGYIFWVKKRSRGLRFDKNRRKQDLNCKFCNSPKDNARYINRVRICKRYRVRICKKHFPKHRERPRRRLPKRRNPI